MRSSWLLTLSQRREKGKTDLKEHGVTDNTRGNDRYCFPSIVYFPICSSEELGRGIQELVMPKRMARPFTEELGEPVQAAGRV